MRTLLMFFAAITVLVAACSSDGSNDHTNASGGGSDSERGLRVVATTTQIGDFARNVGGDRIALTVLLKPNQDAHDFELEPSQVRAIAEADLVLQNGLGLDGFLERALNGSHAHVATLSSGVTTREGGHTHDDHVDEHDGEHHDDDGHNHDPHVWFSIENAGRMVENLRDALIAEDGANADYYRENADRYLEQLEALDAEIQSLVEAVPEHCRKLVTSHDVIGYFAESYGFEVIGSVIPSTTSEAQPSAANIRDVVRLIRDEGVPAIFAEASMSSSVAQQVAREAGVEVVDDLYGDSLGPEGSEGATYVDMMRSNAHKITEALKGC